MTTTGTRLRLLLTTFALTISSSTPVQAALFKQIYTGTVVNGYDYGNLFQAGNDLTGLAFTATYLIDDTAGYFTISGDVTDSTAPYSQTRIIGGSTYSLPSPITAALTINGHTINYDGSISGDIEQDYGYSEQWGTFGDLNIGVSSNGGSLSNNVGSNQPGYLSGGDFRLPLDYAIRPADFAHGGSFSFGGTLNGQLDVTHVTNGPALTAAVPEPASWALMIGGFGIAGGALRRRQTARCISAPCLT